MPPRKKTIVEPVVAAVPEPVPVPEPLPLPITKAKKKSKKEEMIDKKIEYLLETYKKHD